MQSYANKQLPRRHVRILTARSRVNTILYSDRYAGNLECDRYSVNFLPVNRVLLRYSLEYFVVETVENIKMHIK